MDRRTFIRTAALGTASAVALGPDFWRAAYASPAKTGSVYGDLLPPDVNGIRLPAGFKSRVLATAFEPVGTSGYAWHPNPDGAGVFSLPDGGWIYASNSEVPGAGGVGALRFDKRGNINGAHRVIAGTNNNCAGGSTPWGTWLTCEEFDGGYVFECNPRGLNDPVSARRAGLGTFSHEAVAIDADREVVYLTEDETDGCFYRFTSKEWPDLNRGTLEAAVLTKAANFKDADPRWRVTWRKIPRPNILPGRTFTRYQVPGTTPFNGGEGVWYDEGNVYFTTKGDNRVWMFDAVASTMELLYDFKTAQPDAPLKGVDNVLVNRAGQIFVAEDGGDMQVMVIDTTTRRLQPLLQIADQPSSEITGLAFDPSGTRLYFSSQRGKMTDPSGNFGIGITYEVTGPFRVGPEIPKAPRDAPLTATARGPADDIRHIGRQIFDRLKF